MHIFWIVFLPAISYQLLAIAAAFGHLRRRFRNHNRLGEAKFQPGVSVLKPIRGLDPNTYAAFVSQAEQDYPEFELLFGVQDENDPAVAEIRRLQAAFPALSIQLVICRTMAANAKVGTLMDLGRRAQYAIWVVNDSDIKVTRKYLTEIVAPLANPDVGVVTCPYRAEAHSAATTWEALGIATDFMPSTLVAQLLGVREFGFGSTLAFRAKEWNAAGGFASIADYLADDYQLAKQISGSGRRALLSTYTVETSLGEGSWAGVWQHQLRWARTIRMTKGFGYAGLPITQAGVWVAIAALCGAFIPALLLLFFRVTSAWVTGWFILRSAVARQLAWLAPVWDFYGFAVWVGSYCGNQVRWRDHVLRIRRDGKIGR